MPLIDDLLTDLLAGEVHDVSIGIHWTSVIIATASGRRCGLSSTMEVVHDHSGIPDVPRAGRLGGNAVDIATLIRSEKPVVRSVAMAAINALLPRQQQSWQDLNAEEVIAHYGAGKHVAMVGRFPFVPRLREKVGSLSVLEQNPREGDYPAEAASQVIPRAEVVTITGMTFINGTIEGLLKLCSPQAVVMVLGPSTPLSPLLYDYGIDLISGAVVTQIDPVVRGVRQGANFRQLHRVGVRLVTMSRLG